jgi:hypothetical protein
MMDDDNELRKAKWLLFMGVLFLFSAFFAYSELRFAIWGKTTEAEIIETFETSEPGLGRKAVVRHVVNGPENDILAVKFRFKEEGGTLHEERDDVPISWTLDDPEKVTVQYIPGEPESARLAGHSNDGSVYLFLAMLALLMFFGYRLYRHASEAVHGSGRRR